MTGGSGFLDLLQVPHFLRSESLPATSFFFDSPRTSWRVPLLSMLPQHSPSLPSFPKATLPFYPSLLSCVLSYVSRFVSDCCLVNDRSICTPILFFQRTWAASLPFCGPCRWPLFVFPSSNPHCFSFLSEGKVRSYPVPSAPLRDADV